MGVCVLGTTLVTLVRNNTDKVDKLGGRKTSHVTELLQVDMVDRKIRMTSIDCTLDMNLVENTSVKTDQVLSPVTASDNLTNTPPPYLLVPGPTNTVTQYILNSKK